MNRRDDEYGALDDLFGHAEGDHDAPTPDVPQEHAGVRRRGYEGARRQAGSTGPEPTLALDRSALAAWQPTHTEPTKAPKPTEPRRPRSGQDAPGAPPPAAAPPEDSRRRRPGAVVGLAALAVLLVVAAFGVGRLFAEAPQTAQQGSAGESGGAGGSASDESEEQRAAYDGPVSDVQVAGSTASCQAPGSVDAGGNPTSYPSSHAHDGDTSTAWRCDGRGTGERLTITLPQETTVAEVGLVPGYAKTDPVNGADRYAENNRITHVRWTFDDGSSYEQRMSGRPDDRSMRTRRIPETVTGSVVLEVLSSTRGPRNTIAVSEVRIAQPAG